MSRERGAVDRTNTNGRGGAPSEGSVGKRTHTEQLQARGGGGQFAGPSAIGPGKRTLTEQLQARGGQPQSSGPPAHQIAADGVAGPASAFPHRSTIEGLFGQPIAATAHTDAAAASATSQLGTEAYAYGGAVAFGSPSPGLHVAAHEAAHVVQQHAGVQLAGGIGAAGDQYERQADAVADRVVAGQSAAELLDGRGGGGAAAPSIQRYGGAEVPTKTDSPDAKQDPAHVDGDKKLLQHARTTAGLRSALAADPTLAQEIQAFFAAGHDDPELNQLLARAFSGPAADKTDKGIREKTDKDPTDTSQPLPPARSGTNKPLAKGFFTWKLAATDHEFARCDVDFLPNKDKVDAKNISFVQTVLNTVGNMTTYPGTDANPLANKPKYEKFEEPGTKKRADHHPDTENDPFYGAEWDQGAKKWKNERADWTVGKSKNGSPAKAATMWDEGAVTGSRMGKGDAEKSFETVPTVLETREPLGSLKWGFKIKDQPNSPIELTGAEDKDCVDVPSADWGKALDQFYAGKFEAILDEFDIGKADLKPDHKTKLDDIVTKMTANTSLNVELGGACDLTGDEAVNQALSLKRAEAARDYLVGKKIDAGRITVQSYSNDWARVETQQGKSEGKNRRVQVWLH